jgi:hypothetical protein
MVQMSRLNPEQAQRDANDIVPKPPQRLRPSQTFTPLPALWRVILYIGAESERAVGLEVNEQVMVGRADLVDSYMPGFDLTPYGARDAGVSRRHAVLSIADGQVHLRDLDSTNGTRLNGVRLESDRSCKVSVGDRIEFGSLQVIVQNIQPPA